MASLCQLTQYMKPMVDKPQLDKLHTFLATANILEDKYLQGRLAAVPRGKIQTLDDATAGHCGKSLEVNLG